MIRTGRLAHFLPRPPMSDDGATRAAFERLYAEQVERGQGAAIRYELSAPKWQFLCYLAENGPVVLHGSGDPSITVFEPRQSNDAGEFGNRRAIYGARDGIWPIYFAIVDRGRFRISLLNACTRVHAPPEAAGCYYFFSIGGANLPTDPWRSGTVYILPDATFEQQMIDSEDGMTIESTQVASLVPVRPLAKLAVEPDDFPFLRQTCRHDPAVLMPRARANPGGFPWVDE